MQKTNSTYRWMILPALAAGCFGSTLCASRYPSVVEKLYSQKLYPGIASTLSSLSAQIPFSLDDTLYALLLLLLPTLLVLLALRKIRVRTFSKATINTLAAMYLLFYVLWGFNYFREDLNTRLDLNRSTTDTADFIRVLNELIETTNTSYCRMDSLEKNTVDNLVEDSYAKLSETLQLHYPAGSRKDKTITLSRFFAQSGISGYYGPFFSEVHVNQYVLPLEYPVVLAHEKAHQFGVTSESEANFYAWLVCRQSSNLALNYSANLFALRYFFSQARNLKEYPELVAKISPEVRNDIKRLQQHWQQLRNKKYERVASRVNDAYLKTNKIKAGINDYHGVVKHIMDFSLDSTFQRNHCLENPKFIHK